MENKIEKMNRIYFEQVGSSKYQYDLILDDFRNALHSFLIYLVVDMVLCEMAEENIYKQEEWDGKIRSAIGINGNYLQELREFRRVIMLGVIVDLRKLTKAEKTTKNVNSIGSGTIGDFINDLANLEEQDLASMMNGKIISEMVDEEEEQNIKRNFEKAIRMAKKIRSKNYYLLLVKENEGIGLHKDRVPEKRRIVDERIIRDSGCIPCRIKTYADRIKIDVETVEECFNEIAEVIQTYYDALWWCNIIPYTHRKVFDYPEYIRGCFKIFRKEIDEKTIDSIIENGKNKLGRAIDLCWGKYAV